VTKTSSPFLTPSRNRESELLSCDTEARFI
jgi:hypothetical protein